MQEVAGTFASSSFCQVPGTAKRTAVVMRFPAHELDCRFAGPPNPRTPSASTMFVWRESPIVPRVSQIFFRIRPMLGRNVPTPFGKRIRAPMRAGSGSGNVNVAGRSWGGCFAPANRSHRVILAGRSSWPTTRHWADNVQPLIGGWTQPARPAQRPAGAAAGIQFAAAADHRRVCATPGPMADLSSLLFAETIAISEPAQFMFRVFWHCPVDTLVRAHSPRCPRSGDHIGYRNSMRWAVAKESRQPRFGKWTLRRERARYEASEPTPSMTTVEPETACGKRFPS